MNYFINLETYTHGKINCLFQTANENWQVLQITKGHLNHSCGSNLNEVLAIVPNIEIFKYIELSSNKFPQLKKFPPKKKAYLVFISQTV